jgi:Mrp family chromosome partitioning ATPase
VEEFRLAGNLTVIQAALTPVKAVDPDPVRYVVAGLVLGLVLGLVVVLLVEYFDDRLLDPEQLGRATGTGLVVKVPKPPRNARLGDRPAPFALAHAHLMALQHPFHMLLVTGATARDPADGVASELAAAAAEAGQQVAVIPSDARDLARRSPADLTVIAAPSPETSARVVRLAAAGGPVIVVATAGRTRFREAQRTAELLRQAGGQVVAAVLVARGGLNGARGSNGRRHLA